VSAGNRIVIPNECEGSKISPFGRNDRGRNDGARPVHGYTALFGGRKTVRDEPPRRNLKYKAISALFLPQRVNQSHPGLVHSGEVANLAGTRTRVIRRVI
jgi:hypothetical protein